MAQTKTSKVSNEAPKQPSVAEIREFYSKNKDRIEQFAEDDILRAILAV